MGCKSSFSELDNNALLRREFLFSVRMRITYEKDIIAWANQQF